MREILFRGKRLDNGEWIKGSLIIYTLEWNEQKKSYCDIAYSEKGKFNRFEVDPKSIGQYTGFTDTNGKKIFEGDICKTWHHDIGVIRWNKQYCCFDFIKQGAKIDEGELLVVIGGLEVVGNTYDVRTAEAQNGTN